MSVVDKTGSRMDITVVTGEKDEIAPTALSIDYFKALQAHHIQSRLVSVPDAGHEIFLSDSVLTATAALLKE